MGNATKKPIYFIGTGEKIDALDRLYPDRLASRVLGMGDIVSLVEKAQQTLEAEQAERMMKRMMKGQFNMNDLKSQLEQMQKMGGMQGMMSMMPGMGKMAKQVQESGMDDSIIKRQIALINSMTKQERANPGNARIIRGRPHGTAFLFGIVDHRTEFDDCKRTTVFVLAAAITSPSLFVGC